MKILFQGDSITDASRDQRNYHHLGNGYPKYAAQMIREAHPDTDFEFINLGISGNRTGQLFDRLYADAIELQPDIISILIGINDLWHRYEKKPIATTDEQIEVNYRSILKELRAKTNAKIMILSPYLLDCEDKEELREDLGRILPMIRMLANQYADVFVPLDEYFEEAMKTVPRAQYYSYDGVHPNTNGATFIGKIYAKEIEPLLKF